ncbi:globin-coupled sensor protein [Rhizobium sp. TRM95111]|uniref:globin-coupled sensor protein n=1 Tax=Rhizobium alarense TaxID=2846851 RepID=UPI001F332971|nr:globin-coupled sensor protein [Rhizobium alarense]MCF3641749.1 globin-coupled sensor protein [Rhizobium alarense]
MQDTPAEQARTGQAASLRDRLRFAGIDAREGEILRSNRQTLERRVEAALRDLFQRFQTFPDAARHFQSERQIDRLHDLHASHWSVLTDARFDSLYAERVKVLSDAESQMGIDPRWRLAGHAVVMEHVIDGAIEDHWPKSLLPGRGDARRKALSDLVKAFVRTAMVDAEIAVSLRVNEMRHQHNRALGEQREADQAELERVFGEVVRGLGRLDFSCRVEGDMPDAWRGMADQLNASLGEIERQLDAATQGASASDDLSEAVSRDTKSLAERSTTQAGRLRDAAATLASVTDGLKANMAEMARAEGAVENTRHSALRSGEIVTEAISAMSDIEASAEKIGQIIGVIDEIAFQTNLLALNAGIEAARAGDSGRGFAVVAQEVRALAQRSADAAREIKQLVTGTKAQVEAGVEKVNRTQDAIAGIVRQVTEINGAVADIARNGSEGTHNLGSLVSDLDGIGRDVGAGAELALRAGRSGDDLHTVILELGRTIRRFHVHPRHDSEAADGPRVSAASNNPSAQARRIAAGV